MPKDADKFSSLKH